MRPLLYFRGNEERKIITAIDLLFELVEDDWYSTNGLLELIENIAPPIILEKYLEPVIKELEESEIVKILEW